MNMGVQKFFQVSALFLLDIFPEVELLDHIVVLFLIFFLGTSILFSIVALAVYKPNNSAQGFPFLYILTNICYFLAILTGMR